MTTSRSSGALPRLTVGLKRSDKLASARLTLINRRRRLKINVIASITRIAVSDLIPHTEWFIVVWGKGLWVDTLNPETAPPTL